MITDVAALYVDPRGPYPKLVEHWYDEVRDARTYSGPWPVVAHPPCGPWSTLRTLSRETTKTIAFVAIDQVRQWGGILEHPITSGLWKLVKPTIVVEQVDWGHVARKRTGLLIVGTDTCPSMPQKRTPTHWCSGVHTPGARGQPPPGIKICSAQQRRRTPEAFAVWLLELARSCKR
jgi:hypothetical protein